MKFSLFFLSALPLAAFAAPIQEKRTQDFCQQTISTLMGEVQPLMNDMNKALSSVEGVVNAELVTVQTTFDADMKSITTAVEGAEAEIAKYKGLPSWAGNEIASIIKEMVTEMNAVTEKAGKVLGEDKIQASLQPLENAMSGLMYGLMCDVVDMINLLGNFTEAMPGSMASMVNGLLSSL